MKFNSTLPLLALAGGLTFVRFATRHQWPLIP